MVAGAMTVTAVIVGAGIAVSPRVCTRFPASDGTTGVRCRVHAVAARVPATMIPGVPYPGIPGGC